MPRMSGNPNRPDGAGRMIRHAAYTVAEDNMTAAAEEPNPTLARAEDEYHARHHIGSRT